MVTDAGIIASRNDAVSRKLSAYVRDGGTVVLGGVFSGHVGPDDMKTYISEQWDVPWETGSYYRTTLSLNQQAVNRPTGGLPSSYSQKAVHLKNVDPDAAWYIATDDSVVESLVPIPGNRVELLHTPVIFAKFGNGWLGYLGDVNGEVGTSAVALGMFGLI